MRSFIFNRVLFKQVDPAIVAEIMSEGEIFQITKHGRAVAELRPPTSDPAQPQRGAASGPNFWMADDFDDPL